MVNTCIASEISYRYFDTSRAHNFGPFNGSDGVVSVQGTPGEVLSFGLAIKSPTHAFKNVSINLIDPDKSGSQQFINKSTVRVLTSWYQANNRSINPDVNGTKHLVNELLLFDTELIKVNHAKKENALRVNGKYQSIKNIATKLSHTDDFNDAASLLPIDLGADKTTLLWVTLRLAKNSTANVFSANIELTMDATLIQRIPLKVTVLPFQLPHPSLEYGLYYRARLSDEDHPPNSNHKRPSQYRLELENMVEHGIEQITLYEKMASGRLEEALTLRDQANVAKTKLYAVGRITGKSKKPEQLSKLRDDVRLWLKTAKKWDYQSVYFYGIDEASNEDLTAQRAAWKVVHKAGGKVFAACQHDCYGIVRDLLDQPILLGKFKNEQASEWQALEKSALIYGNPMVGIENAELYRSRYGFALWLSPYAGVMNYAYQHGANHIWNDFDHKKYRDHVFAYPTNNGLIDTIQWEGMREAIIDTRYADKLAALIGKQRAKKLIHHLVNTSSSMQRVRNKVIWEIQTALSKKKLTQHEK